MKATNDKDCTSHRPSRKLLLMLTRLRRSDCVFDVSRLTDIERHELLKTADTVSGSMKKATRTVGNMLALVAADIEDGAFSGSDMEAFGWLIAELSDLATACDEIAVACRRSLGAKLLVLERSHGGGSDVAGSR